MVISCFMSQWFIVILILTELIFFIHKESILGGIESTFQVKTVWLELLGHDETLSLNIWFVIFENLLSLVVFTAQITVFFVNRNRSIITDILSSNWVWITGCIDSSPDFSINVNWSSSGWIWTWGTHFSSHKLRSTFTIVFGLPDGWIFFWLLFGLLLGGVHVVNVSASTSWGVVLLS